MSKIKWNIQQEQVIGTRDSDLVVSASAGSGKSAVMLERVMQILKSNIPLPSVLMLSYNVAIATELKQKLTRKIAAELKSGGSDTLYLADALDAMDNASIFTIDSFCSRLIKEFFQRFNIDPNYSIMEQNEQKAVLKAIIDEEYTTYKNKNGVDAYKLADKFGGESSICEIIESIIAFTATLPNPDEWLSDGAFYSCGVTLGSSGISMELLALIKRRGELLHRDAHAAISIIGGVDRFCDDYMAKLEVLDDIMSASSYSELHDITQIMTFDAKVKKCKKDEENPAAREAYVRYVDAIKTFAIDVGAFAAREPALVESELAEGRAIIGALLDIVVAVRTSYQQFKLDNARFEFSDLSYYTIKLLEHDDIAAVVRDRYRYICIDEFQDADYRQEYILSRITNNNLFIVGDGKQSIYRFRMAEPAILANKFRDIDKGSKEGVAIRLNQNYRSDKRVLDYVNDIFNVVMEKTFSKVDYASDEQLIAGSEYEHHDGGIEAVEVYMPQEGDIDKESKPAIVFYEQSKPYDIVGDDSSKSTKEGISKEAEYIYNKIVSLVGKQDIYDINTKEWRKVGYGDIAILARNRSSAVSYILKYLQDKSLPVDDHNLRRESGSDIIASIINVMRCVDNHKNDIYMAAALLSHVGGLSYSDLASIRKANASCDYFWEACEAHAHHHRRLKNFYDRLQTFREVAAIEGVYGLAHSIVYSTGLETALYEEGSGDSDVYVIEQFLTKLQAVKISLHDYIAGQEVADDDSYEQYMSGYADKLIQTSTIHASKGLEYPIVFLVNADRPLSKSGGRNVADNNIIMSREYGIIVQNYDDNKLKRRESMAAKVIKAIQKDEDLLESMRLLYVATTRAKNHLFITAGDIKGEQDLPYKVNSFAEWINNAARVSASVKASIMRGNQYASQMIAKSTENAESIHAEQSDTACKSAAEIDTYLNYKYPYEEATKIGIKYTVTEINHDFCYEDNINVNTTLLSETEQYTADKKQRGTNYHKIFEHINYEATTVEQVSREIDRMLTSGELTPSDIEGINIEEIARVLAMDIMKSIAYEPQHREKQFMLTLPISHIYPDIRSDERVLVQGAIDLLVDGKDLIIIDFKKSNKSAAKLVESYGKQMQLYKIAVTEALGKQPHHTYIIEIGRAELIEFFWD